MREAVRCYNLLKGEFRFAFTHRQMRNADRNGQTCKTGQCLQGNNQLHSRGPNISISTGQGNLHYC